MELAASVAAEKPWMLAQTKCPASLETQTTVAEAYLDAAALVVLDSAV